MAQVSVVTGTTGYLPAELSAHRGITLVSLYYSFSDGPPCREDDLDQFAPFYDRLRATQTRPTTSPVPAPRASSACWRWSVRTPPPRATMQRASRT